MITKLTTLYVQKVQKKGIVKSWENLFNLVELFHYNLKLYALSLKNNKNNVNI